MITYHSLNEIIEHPGLRIVLVKGMPNPWAQAAKTIFEIKNLAYIAAAWDLMEPNVDIVKWGGESSAPIVAWKKERPINRWIDILILAERIAPMPSLMPKHAAQRALMFGLSHEICGEYGIGWNRRLHMVASMIPTGDQSLYSSWAEKYRYNQRDADRSADLIAASLRALAEQLRSQHERGMPYFIGNALTALDVYWAAFATLFDPLPNEQCPMPERWRPDFVVTDAIIKDALDPILLEHRARIFHKYFRDPMEF